MTRALRHSARGTIGWNVGPGGGRWIFFVADVWGLSKRLFKLRYAMAAPSLALLSSLTLRAPIAGRILFSGGNLGLGHKKIRGKHVEDLWWETPWGYCSTTKRDIKEIIRLESPDRDGHLGP